MKKKRERIESQDRKDPPKRGDGNKEKEKEQIITREYKKRERFKKIIKKS